MDAARDVYSGATIPVLVQKYRKKYPIGTYITYKDKALSPGMRFHAIVKAISSDGKMYIEHLNDMFASKLGVIFLHDLFCSDGGVTIIETANKNNYLPSMAYDYDESDFDDTNDIIVEPSDLVEVSINSTNTTEE